MGLTVSQLRKALKGMNGNLPVYWRDHDQCRYETNSPIVNVEILNQDKAIKEKDYEIDGLDPVFIKHGNYVVLSP